MTMVSNGLTINQEKAIRARKADQNLRPRLDLFEKLGRAVALERKSSKLASMGIATKPADRRAVLETIDIYLKKLGLEMK